MANLLTGIYVLKLNSVQPEVAHLYEHLIIDGFDEYLVKNNYKPYLKGWVSGQTYNKVIFIDYGFYDSKIEKLFIKYLKTKPQFEDRQVFNQLSRLCSESKTSYFIKDLEMLKKIFFSFENNWINLSDSHKAEYIDNNYNRYKKIIVKNPKQLKYKDYKLIVGLNSSDINLIAAYFRLFPIICDVINYSINQKGFYSPEYSDFKYSPKEKFIFNEVIITVPKDTNKLEIEKHIIMAVNNIDLEQLNKMLNSYLDAYLNTPNWSTFTLDYFDATNILVSKKDIINVLKQKVNVQKILKNLIIKFKN